MAPYTNRDTTSPAAVISPACQSYHEISRVMATACTKPFATLSRIATALVSTSPSSGGERGCQLAEAILAEIAERHALEDFPHFNALVRAHIVAGEHTAFRGPLSEYDFPGDAQAHKPARRGNGEPATAGRGQHGLQRHHDGEHRNDFRNGVQHPVAKGTQQIRAATA